eukprot:m.262943 g.262943  ORF g.262943 m.262943 type:complete len:356 (-) comp19705_c0_seq1:464-1531(-)
MSIETISTPFCKRLGIQRPIILAGMATVSSPELAAAVTNAGGLGVIGGAFIPVDKLRKRIRKLKSLISEGASFGVDLLLPAVGGNARATNYDYTKGLLPELIDVVIEERARLFVAAVGVPPKWVVEKLHDHGVLVMNMVGSPKHVHKAIAVGVDAVCAQGTEAGGHTGNIASMPLIPQCVDICRKFMSPLTGDEVAVVGAGGIFDGRGLAAAVALGAQAAWVGTRFVAATEAAAGARHQRSIISSTSDDTIRTLIYSGRPMRVLKTEYILDWEVNRREEAARLLTAGQRPHKTELIRREHTDDPLDFSSTYPVIFGQSCGGVINVQPAAEIMDHMMTDAVAILKHNHAAIVPAKL